VDITSEYNMKKLQAFLYFTAVTLLCCAMSRAGEPNTVARALESLGAVHQLSETAISPEYDHSRER
jgi:hypothetical protein